MIHRPHDLRPNVLWWGDLDLDGLKDDTCLTAPFPYFGGKRRVAPLVWRAFGPVVNYVEPFFGSGAVMLGRPEHLRLPNMRETVNDKDALLANFWRAVQTAPADVAAFADWPVSEVDLTARNAYLSRVRDDLRDKLVADPEYFDAKLAGWWVWGISQWIGSGFAQGTRGQMPEVAGYKDGRGTVSVAKGNIPEIAGDYVGRGILAHDARANLTALMEALAARLRFTRIVSGDWTRVMTNTPLRPTTGGESPTAFTGIFLDPPYDIGHWLYAEGHKISSDVRAWCVEHGHDPAYRIALCGFDGEHNDLDEAHGWICVAWKGKGYNTDQTDGLRERIWFSPACLPLIEPKHQQKQMLLL